MFLRSSFGRQIYSDLPTIDEYWDLVCHLYNNEYYGYRTNF